METHLKRTALTSAVLALAAFSATYYSFPHWFKEPLLELNRKVAGLEEKRVTVDAHTIHYLEGGNGEPLILLHGIFAEKEHWVDFARHLTGHYRVVAPDLPGYGESSRHPSQHYDYKAQTERLKNLLDAMGIPRAHLAGNSMGGTIAALFAMQYPERVASVALIGSPHGIRSPRPSEMDQRIAEGKSPLVVRNTAEFEDMLSLVFAKRPFLPYPILHAAEADAVANADSNASLWREQLKDRYLLEGSISGMQVRTLVLWGDSDKVFDISGADVLKAKLKNVDVHILNGVGHLPMMEAPKESSRLYADFLRKVSG